MNTITNLFQQSQLAEAAYANLTNAIGDQTLLKQALDVANKDQFGGSFSSAQATDFVSNWRVINQYTAPGGVFPVGGTGFSATLFQDIGSGKYAFAIRGTEPGLADLFGADGGDIAADGIAMDQAVDLYNYWQRLITSKGVVYPAARLDTMLAETAVLKGLNAQRLGGQAQAQATYIDYVNKWGQCNFSTR
jgi:hypothetical protein